MHALFVRTYLFIYFWLCWVLLAMRGLSLVAAGVVLSSCSARLLIEVASLVVERWYWACSLQLLLHGAWNLPSPGIEPMSPTLAGGLLTRGPPGKSHVCFSTCQGLQTSPVCIT